MKTYYTNPKYDPDSSVYDPTALKHRQRRPLYTENDELRDLRTENLRLLKLLEQYQDDTSGKKEETTGPSAGGVKVEVKEIEGDTHKQVDIEDVYDGGDKIAIDSGLLFTAAVEEAPVKAPAKASRKRPAPKKRAGKK
jgi:hypothetical protein